MRPASGRTMPAMQLRTVVLPAPDAPKRMVKPGCASKETSRSEVSPAEPVDDPAAGANRFWMRASSTGRTILVFLSWNNVAKTCRIPDSAVHGIYAGEQKERDDEEELSRLIGSGIVHRLHLVVDVDGDRAGHTGNVPPTMRTRPNSPSVWAK